MKGFREIVKTFDDASMDIIYILGYLLVPGPKPPEHQLSQNDPWLPLRVTALAIVSLIIATILITSFFIALLFMPLLCRSRRWEN